jgi:hypothetical protein
MDRTDRKKPIVTSCNFANTPKNYYKKWLERFKETPEN